MTTGFVSITIESIDNNSIRQGHNGIHGHEQFQWLTGQGDESKLPIEFGNRFVQRIDNYGVDSQHMACLGDTLQSIDEYDRTQTLSLMGLGYCKPSQQDYW